MGLASRAKWWVYGLKGRAYYGWFVTGAAAGVEFGSAAAAITILTIFVNPMTEEFGWSRTQISGAASVAGLLGAALAPLTGRMVDKFGSRLILTVASMSVAISCFYLSGVQTLAGFYIAYSIARTADQGVIKIGTLPVVAKWFQVYRGRAVALVSFTGLLNLIIMAPLILLVIDAWGWRVAWLMLGGLMIITGVLPSAFFIRRQPEDMGLPIDGIATPARVAGPLDRHGAVLTTTESDLEWTLGQVMRTPAFWVIVVSIFVVSITNAGVMLHLIPYLAKEQGLRESSAVGTISVFSASAAVAALFLGIISERASPRIMMLLAHLTAAAALLVLITADTLLEAYLFAVIQGAATGGVNVLAAILLSSYYGRWVLGSTYGIVRSALAIGSAIGALLAGMVYDATGSYQTAFQSFLVMALLSSAMMLLVRRPIPPIPPIPRTA